MNAARSATTAAPPSGTVTFLFTDVEGSTKRAYDDAAGWAAARTRHQEIVGAAIERRGGFIFHIVGDAVVAAFSTVDAAVAAAIEAQRGLRAERWSSAPVKVRMGLHAGAAEWHGNDYEGYLTLAHAERLMSAGHGGQILLSQTAADLVGSELPAGLSLRDLGVHRLKDLPQAEHLFQLVAADLPVDFPPLRSLGGSSNNLPTPVTSFVGREQELAELRSLLSSARLLTLTGPGGTGKTRLALRLASDQLVAYPDGAWLIELAPVGDPTMVIQTMASALGLQEEQGRATWDVVKEYLRVRTVLLILDNCEHLIESCAQLAADVLNAAAGATVLATSREPLGIAGETAYRVPSLPLPDQVQDLPLAQAAANDCVRLFVERASAADPHFRLTATNASPLAQICRRLDGIPLAIELAAARIRAFAPHQIAGRLDDRFRLLTGGSRTALERHQTLEALIDWSHDLLSEDERVLLRRLSVFADGWSLEAAQEVCGDDGGADIPDRLARLADKSLVMVDQSSAPAEARYRLLETIRQYARDKLLAAGESQLIRDRHLAHIQSFVEQAEPRLRSADQLVWLERLEAEHDNIRAALAWAVERRDAERALRVAGAAAYFWGIRGYWSEGYGWLDQGLALPPAKGRRATTTGYGAPRAKALYGLGGLLFASRGEPTRSRAVVEESLELWRELGDIWWMAVCLDHIGFMLLWDGDIEAARGRVAEGVSLARRVENRWPLALCLNRMGSVLMIEDAPAARLAREEAVAVAREVGDQSLLSQALQGLAFLSVREGDIAAAGPIALEALAKARAIGTVTQIFLSLLILSLISALQGEAEVARGYCLDLFALASERGSVVVQLVGLLASGLVASFGPDPAEGVRLLTAIARFAEQLGVKGGAASIFTYLVGPTVDIAQQRLSPEEYEAAVQGGRGLTLEEALRIATT